MLVGVLNLLLITMVFSKFLAIPMKNTKIWNILVTKIIRNQVKQYSYHEGYWKLRSKSFKRYIYSLTLFLMLFRYHSNVICISLVCHSYLPYVPRMDSYVIRLSLVCTRMSSVCHSYVTRLWFDHELLSVWNCCSCSYIFCNFSFW